MAKEKQTRRLIAMALAASVVTSALPVTAFAETDGASENSTNTGSTTTTTNSDGSSSETTKTTTGDGSASAPKVTVTVTVNKDAAGDETSRTESTTTEASDKDANGVGKSVTETTTTTTTPNGSGGIVETDVDKTWSTTTSETKTQEDTQEKQEHTPGAGGAVSPDTPVVDADKPYPGDPTGTGQDSYENSQQGEAQTPDYVKDFVEGTTITNTTTTEGEHHENHTDATDSKDRPIENSGSVSGSETTTNTVVKVEKTEEARPDDEGNSYEKVETTDPNSKPITEGNTEDDWVEGQETEGEAPEVPAITLPDAGNTEVELDREGVDEDGNPILKDTVENTTTVSVYENVLGQLKSGLDEDIENGFKAEFGNDVVIGTTGDKADINATVEYTATRVDAAGNTIVTTVKLIPQTAEIGEGEDKKTYVVGYTTEKSEVITPKDGTLVSDVTEQTNQEFGYEFGDVVVDGDTEGKPVVTTRTEIELPKDMPAEGTVSVKVNESGNTETTTVEYIREEIDGEEKITGYKNVVVLTNEAGEVIGGGEDLHNGKKSVVVTTSTKEVIKTTTIDTDTKQTIVTTKEVTKNVTTSTATVDVTKLDREVWAKLWGITSETGGTNIESLQSMIDIDGDGAKDLAWIDPKYEKIEHNLGPDGIAGTADDVKPGDDQIQYIRHILKSDFKVHRTTGDDTTTFIYELVDKTGEKKFYGYCVDMATTARKGYFYEIENLEDQDYYQSSKNESGAVMNTEATDKLRAVALNGFWGTESGTGSLQAVKDLLKGKVGTEGFDLTEDEIDNLTEGQALAATQAAMWVYGNSGDRKIDMDDIVQEHVNGSAVSEDDDKLIQGLFNVLTALPGISKDAENAGTNILDEKDFLGAAIVVKDKATDLDERFDGTENTDDDTTNDVYNTTVGFKLAVSPGEGDQLNVVIMDSNNNVIKTETLQNAHKGDGSYEVNNVVLQEGVEINLKISGTQHLDQGVYLYTSEKIGTTPSQTFISVAEGERNVSLDVNLEFTVDEPEYDASSNRKHRADKRTETTTTEKTFHETEKIVTALVEVTTTTTTTTEDTWNGEYNEEWSYNEGGNGGGKDPEPEKPTEDPEDSTDPKEPTDPGDSSDDEKEDLLDIGDEGTPRDDMQLLDAEEEVPLVAGIPETGDNNHVMGFGAMALAALAGMFGLRKKENH